jgi:hypothetical protein
MNEKVGFKVGDFVSVPTSVLGKKYGVGKILAIWFDKMSIDFSGHLGNYTMSKHTIIPVEFFGMDVVLDETIPKNEIHLKFKEGTRFP